MRRARPDAIISIHRGKVYIEGREIDARLREPFWIMRTNQSLLLPGLRRSAKKNIYIAGKKAGYGEFCGGAVPIKSKRNREEYWSDHIENILAETLGICTHGRKRGYYRVVVDEIVFIVDVYRNDRQDYHCMLYTKHNSDYIGDIVFNSTFTNVHTRLGVARYEPLFCVVIGYVLDALMGIAVGRLSNSLEVVY